MMEPRRGKQYEWVAMTWDEKCWGIFNNIYWEMRFAGVKGFKLTSQLAEQLRELDVPVPKGDGIYVRVDNDADNTKKLLSQEVVLNTFSISRWI
jgi:hypothetical protein